MPKPMMDEEETIPGGTVQETDPPEESAPLDGQDVDPKVMQQFDMLMSYGIKIIHEPKYSDRFVKAVKGVTNPNDLIDMLARATVDIVTRIDTVARKSGDRIDGSALLNGANQLMGELINIAEMVKAPKLDDDQKASAMSLAISTYLDQAVKSGAMTPEEVQAASEKMKQTPTGQKVVAEQQKMGSVFQNQEKSAPVPAKPVPVSGGLLAPRGRK